MKLITKNIQKNLPQLYTTDDTNIESKKFYIHYFNPLLNWDWWACEYDPKEQLFFGYVNLNDNQNAEWGYFSIHEFESFNEANPLFPVEREINFKPTQCLKVKHPSLKPLHEGE